MSKGPPLCSHTQQVQVAQQGERRSIPLGFGREFSTIIVGFSLPFRARASASHGADGAGTRMGDPHRKGSVHARISSKTARLGAQRASAGRCRRLAGPGRLVRAPPFNANAHAQADSGRTMTGALHSCARERVCDCACVRVRVRVRAHIAFAARGPLSLLSAVAHKLHSPQPTDRPAF